MDFSKITSYLLILSYPIKRIRTCLPARRPKLERSVGKPGSGPKIGEVTGATAAAQASAEEKAREEALRAFKQAHKKVNLQRKSPKP